MNNEEAKKITEYIRSADSNDTAIKIMLDMTAEAVKPEVRKELTSPVEDGNFDKSRAITFTTRELNKMPKTFKKLFKYNKVLAHVYKRKDGVYEVRCMINGIRYTGRSVNLERAKERFIEKLGGEDTSAIPDNNPFFPDYVLRWMETVKKPFVQESTYETYCATYRSYVEKKFKGKRIKEITSFMLQQYINHYVKENKLRTAKKIFIFLSPCFKYAVAEGIIDRNPLDVVVMGKYEQQHGTPLTREEEQTLVTALKKEKSPYAQAMVFLMYSGLRIGELPTAQLKDGWISVITEKTRKGLNEKVRSIPLNPILKELMPYIDFENIKKLNSNTIGRHVKDYFENHHTHDFRHTFVTRAQECGCRREIVSLWVGHSADSSITSTVYTHLEQNLELQLEEMNKFYYKV